MSRLRHSGATTRIVSIITPLLLLLLLLLLLSPVLVAQAMDSPDAGGSDGIKAADVADPASNAGGEGAGVQAEGESGGEGIGQQSDEDVAAETTQSCPMPDAQTGESAEGCGASAEQRPSAQSTEKPGAEEIAKAQEELTALEERLIASRAVITELVTEVQRQEGRIFELQRMIGGPTRLQAGGGAGPRLGPGGGSSGGIGAFKVHREAWADHMAARVAVRTAGNVTAATVVCSEPAKKSNKAGPTCHYVVLGDSGGRLYFFHPVNGALGAEYDTGSGSPVTAFDHWQIRRNTTALATGHANGDVLLHLVHERVGFPGGVRRSNSPEPVRAPVRADGVGAVLNSTGWAALAAQHDRGAAGTSSDEDEGSSVSGTEAELEGNGNASGAPAVVFLDSFRCGRHRCLTVADDEGGFGVFYENGTVRNYDGVTMSGHRPLATRISASYSSVIYGPGMATMPMRVSGSGTSGFVLTECKGLNESSMTAFSWDSTNANRAYAVADNGDILVVLAQGTRQPKQGPSINSKGSPASEEHSAKSSCFIRSRSPSLLPPEKLVTAHIKGYLFAASAGRIGVFNTTSYYRSGIQEVLVEPLETLAAELEHIHPEDAMPLLVSDGDKLVVVGFGSTVAAFYSSNLFISTPYDMSGLTGMTQPIFIAAMIIVGLWQFYRARSKATGKHGNDAASKLLDNLPPNLRGKVASELEAAGGLAGLGNQRSSMGGGGGHSAYGRRQSPGGAGSSRFSGGYGGRY